MNVSGTPVLAGVAENCGPLTEVSIRRQVASLSETGSVAVTQSTILRSPVVVFCSAGCARSTPESRTPMVTPRPSAFGFFFTKSTAPVSKDGLYGFSAGVFLFGAAYVLAVAEDAAPFAVSALGVGSSSAMSWRRSMACTEDSFAAAAIAESAFAVGTVART